MGCNPSDEELQEMIAEMDEDNSGTVDFEVKIQQGGLARWFYNK